MLPTSPVLNNAKTVRAIQTGCFKNNNNKGSDWMAISNILKDIRLERNLIQEDLAEATGSCSRTIGRIERGERNPSLEMAIRLAHYLNMGVEEIFKLDDDTSCQKKNRGMNPRFFYPSKTLDQQ